MNIVTSNTCLIFSNHTNYNYFKYNEITDIPTDWIKKHIGQSIEPLSKNVFPKSILEGVFLLGVISYRVFKCDRGLLQYCNNEIGFLYNTGSYMYIRFESSKDALEYLELLLFEYDIELTEFFTNYDNIPFHTGDSIKVKNPMTFHFNANVYRKLLKNETLYFDYLDSQLTNNTDRGIELAEVNISPDTILQVYTTVVINNNLFIIPKTVPDVTQLRLKGVKQLPYLTVSPDDMLIPYDNINLYKLVNL